MVSNNAEQHATELHHWMGRDRPSRTRRNQPPHAPCV